jgi:feruloyl esterase
VGYFSNMVYEKSDWDPKSFKVDEALSMAESKTAQKLNSTDPDLRPFMKRGGKLILYHGWSDAAIPATNSIDYYNTVVSALGQPEVDSFVRLYMVPGMQHCSGGPGPHSFGEDGAPVPDGPEHNIYTALQQWVEKGSAPSRIVATRYNDGSDPAKDVKMTRPLCPYPQVAKYNGTGDANDAASFACRNTVK